MTFSESSIWVNEVAQRDPAAPSVGFACLWDEPPEPTWSYTPWNMRDALAARTLVCDIGVTWPRTVRAGLQVMSAHRVEGRWRSSWKQHRATQSIVQRRLIRSARRRSTDVVLQIGDLARLPTDYLLYQDLSIDLLLEFEREDGKFPHFPGIDRDSVRRLADRQREIYNGAAGVLAMSNWLAEHLVRVSGLPAERVHVVPPGLNVAPALTASPRPIRDVGGRILFVGKDFGVKSGRQVVDAWRVIRREIDPAVELTVAGPPTWPLPGAVPDGVHFLGTVPRDEVRRLYLSHDLFVMPSVFEGFGIAFVEALAHGIPCIARDACAMPEFVEPGVNGDLVCTDDPRELAEVVVTALRDGDMRERTRSAAPGVVRRFSWARAADDVLAVAAGLA